MATLQLRMVNVRLDSTETGDVYAQKTKTVKVAIVGRGIVFQREGRTLDAVRDGENTKAVLQILVITTINAQVKGVPIGGVPITEDSVTSEYPCTCRYRDRRRTGNDVVM